MADFCKQCSEATFGEDFGELANISTSDDTEKKLYALVICEGCGVTQVDHLGVCIATDCLEKHGDRSAEGDSSTQAHGA